MENNKSITNDQIAEVLGISSNVVENWEKKFPELMVYLREFCWKKIEERCAKIANSDFLNKKCMDCCRDGVISVRIYSACHWAQLETLGDVIRYGRKNLSMVPSFGKKSLDELTEFFRMNGIEFE